MNPPLTAGFIIITITIIIVVIAQSLTRASATAASTSVPVFRTLMALTDAEILAWWIKPYRSVQETGEEAAGTGGDQWKRANRRQL